MLVRRLKDFCFMLFCCFMMLYWKKDVAADMIVEPNDAFYMSHKEECTSIRDEYLANGTDGFSTLYLSPSTKLEVFQVENATSLYATWVYLGESEEEWLYCSINIEDKDGKVSAKTGWMKKADCLLVYDGGHFYEDKEEKLAPYRGEFANYEIKKEILVWSYPSSGKVIRKLTEFDTSSIMATYQDDKGNQWGYVNYYRGRIGGWICMSDPENDKLPIHEISTGELISPVTPKQGGIAKQLPFLIAMGCVLIVVVITLLIIRKYYGEEEKLTQKK